MLGAQAHSAQVMIDGLVDGILVAPEKRFVRAGEALNVDLTSSHNGRVLVDALREGKVLASGTPSRSATHAPPRSSTSRPIYTAGSRSVRCNAAPRGRSTLALAWCTLTAVR